MNFRRSRGVGRVEISLLLLQAAKQVSKILLKLLLGTQVQSSKDIWQLYSKINQVHSATMQEDGQGICLLSQIMFSIFHVEPDIIFIYVK